MMDIRTLRYFLAIAREQNMTAAAEVLHVSQPTLSRTMSELEKECGRQLFYRTNKNTFLNDDGMYLRTKAETIVSLFDEVEQEMHSHTSALHGQVRIGTERTVKNDLLTRSVNELHAFAPDVTFMLFTGNTDELESHMNDDNLDLAFIYEPVNSHVFDYVHIADDIHFCVLMRRDSPFAQETFLTDDELSKMPLLVHHDRFDVLNNKVLNEEKEKYHITGDYNEIGIAAEMVRSGICCALAFDNMIKTDADDELVLVPVKNVEPVHMALISKKHHMLSPQAEAILKIMTSLNEKGSILDSSALKK